MPAGSTYEPIATTTLGSAAATVTFSTISGSYTDLILVSNAGCSSAGNVLRLTVNSDTAGNYSNTVLVGTGTTAYSLRNSSTFWINVSQEAGLTTSPSEFNAITNFMNYSNSTTYKTVLTRNNITTGSFPATEARVSLWRSTSAITSIQLFCSAGNIVAGSTFTLYGITAA